MDKIILENQKTWDAVADQFVEASALPVWGPFGVGDDLNLIPEIKDKTFLEIGCGSGRQTEKVPTTFIFICEKPGTPIQK